MTKTVGQVIVSAIAAEGVNHVFCVPGESYLPVLDAFHDHPEISLVTTHHEEGAGFMADAWSRSTGRPGVFMVTRGPGLTHAAIAVHAARQDSTPLVLLVGQVPREDAGRESFQELDVVAFGKLVGKDAVEITEADRAAEQIQRAFYLAQAGRPGPVVVSLPEDVGYHTTERAQVKAQRVPVPCASEGSIAAAAETIVGADSVAVLMGGGMGSPAGRQAGLELAEVLGAPVYCGWRRFDVYPNTHPQFAGNVPWLSGELLAPLREAEVVLALGTRMGDFSSLSYQVPGPHQRLIQVDLDAASMSVRGNPHVPIVGDAGDAAARLAAALRNTRAIESRREGWLVAAERAHERYLLATEGPQTPLGGPVDLPAAMRQLREIAPKETCITSDAGAFASYLNRYYRWSLPRTFLGTTSGSMGYAVPSAIGAKLGDRSRPVIAVAGDGGFAMTMSEVHTAVRLGLGGLVFLVFDNGTYGTIRAHQANRFPGREIGVDQGSADLARLARSLGAAGFRCQTNVELSQALRQALRTDVPAVVQVMVEPSQLGAWA